MGGSDEHLFVLSSGKPPHHSTLSKIFLRLARQIGYRGGPGEPGSRLHDLRHGFATRSLENAVAVDRDSVSRHVLALSTYLGHVSMASTYWYLEATPVLLREIARAAENTTCGEDLEMTALSPHISKFLYEYLPRDRGASQHTIDSYSESFLQLIDFAENRLRVRACTLKIEQLTAEVILDFLEHLERDRGNTIGTRNVRLAAIKSFFRFLEHRAPACLHLAAQVHAISA